MTEVEIGLELNTSCLTVTVIDPDTEPFDLTKAGNVDTSRPIHERKPGGLGVFLIKRLMDDVSYEHADRVSTIRMMKKLESKNV
jgi:serine/threonine-protein kinase RsbW